MRARTFLCSAGLTLALAGAPFLVAADLDGDPREAGVAFARGLVERLPDARAQRRAIGRPVDERRHREGKGEDAKFTFAGKPKPAIDLEKSDDGVPALVADASSGTTPSETA